MVVKILVKLILRKNDKLIQCVKIKKRIYIVSVEEYVPLNDMVKKYHALISNDQSTEED